MKKLKAYYLFGRSPLPADIAAELSKELAQLQKNKTREAYLKAAYHLITTRYGAGRIHTYLRLFDVFSTSFQDLWNRSGFMHCTNQNYLLAALLIKGGRFTDADVRLKWTLVAYISLHQYLQVRIADNRWVNVDCWARHYGVGFGNYAHGFNTTLFKSFAE